MTTFIKIFFLILLSYSVTSLGNLKSYSIETILAPTIKNYPHGVPCTIDPSKAWVNIVILIDTSAYMSDARLRQIGLSLSSELSQYTFGDYSTPFTSRVGIITYDSNYTIIGDLNTFNNISSISTALLGLKTSNVKSAYGLEKALAMSIVWVDDVPSDATFRETLIIIYSASLEGVNQYQLDYLGVQDECQNLVTVNIDPTNENMTKAFEIIATQGWNLSINDPKLYEKIDVAISQTNCFCEGEQLFTIHPSTNNFTRYAECFLVSTWWGFWDNQTFTELCPTNQYPMAINNEFRNKFVMNDSDYFDMDGNIFSFYTGLHRNNKNNWVWFDYDGSELTENFTYWAKGFDNNSPGECVIAKSEDYGKPWYWYPASCYPARENATTGACQSLACDASRTFPCAGLNPQEEEFDVKKMRKLRNKRSKRL